MQHALTPSLQDTIVACATGPSAGALAIIRLAGPEAIAIGQKIAPSKRSRESHRLELTEIFDPHQNLLDEAMIVEMHAPRSYTGDDVVEFHLHGAPIIIKRVTHTLQEHGARLANPGEYTLRAYVHGKLDLTQAEAVADLIAARSESELRVAGAQLKGKLSSDLNDLVDSLETILRDWQAVLDFPEYPSGEGLVSSHREHLDEIKCKIQEKINAARIDLLGGREIVLCGAPNVGKSTLLNTLAGEQRVLVDAEPGTTRDPVRVDFEQHVQRWSLWDTAGIRAAESHLEKKGIDLTHTRIDRADLALWIVAADQPVMPPEGLDVVLAMSKSDLLDAQALEALAWRLEDSDWPYLGAFSAQNVEGLEQLSQALNCAEELSDDILSGVVVKERHLELLKQAYDVLVQLLASYDAGQSLDVLAMDLEVCIEYIGEIVGRDVKAEVLEQVFSQFCIGK